MYSVSNVLWSACIKLKVAKMHKGDNTTSPEVGDRARGKGMHTERMTGQRLHHAGATAGFRLLR